MVALRVMTSEKKVSTGRQPSSVNFLRRVRHAGESDMERTKAASRKHIAVADTVTHTARAQRGTVTAQLTSPSKGGGQAKERARHQQFCLNS